MITFVDADKVRRKRDPGRCYIKAGFRFAEEKRAPDFQAAIGVPGLRRLARDI